ncbi:protein quaking-like isoform X1 [Xenia sp. Carnegie-2017]|uniref:protein quaking-like isoform X1 n=2 Tax=Xenia sp. Carnegie-2017 TaxID=2897299 RepID=UPI001F038E58|nr:protein quaking-like isoform X1 [Xenia sp. Carnegie-2017]
MNTSEYLNQLLKDKTTISKMPKIFLHLERLLDEEINRIRTELFHGPCNGLPVPAPAPLNLPPSNGNIVKLTEKVFAPVKEFPKFNFVGRIIGPRGLTLRKIEAETGCKLLVRGKGSMKDKKMEEEKRGQPNYEHLEEDLHVLIAVEDSEDRATMRLDRAVNEIKMLMKPVEDGDDEIKREQLGTLALINGTYRPPGSNGNMNMISPPVTPVSGTFPVLRTATSGNHLPSQEFSFPQRTGVVDISMDGTFIENGGLFGLGSNSKLRRGIIREHPYSRFLLENDHVQR